MTKKIVALAGDGIGPEIMTSAIKVLKSIEQKYGVPFQIESRYFGGVAIDHEGTPLSEEMLNVCKQADAILLGAIGGPKWTDSEVTPEKGLLKLREALELFANIRPIRVTEALAHLSPLKEEIVRETDFVIVRELTSGIYFWEPRFLQADEALDSNRYQRHEIDRIIRQAFKLAKKRRKKVTSVDKANVLSTSKLWRQVAEKIAKEEYPDCQLEHQYVDSSAMKLIQSPTDFDVIVTENLFGDILSDEASVLPGSLGVLSSASHSESGPSLYEPIQGSAPDIAGKNLANPVSMILSVAMMLRESFGMTSAAEEIEHACDEVLQAGIMTRDLGGQASTEEVTEQIVQYLKKSEGK